MAQQTQHSALYGKTSCSACRMPERPVGACLSAAQHDGYSGSHQAYDEQARAQRRGHRQAQVLMAAAGRHGRKLREQIRGAAGKGEHCDARDGRRQVQPLADELHVQGRALSHASVDASQASSHSNVGGSKQSQ